MTVYYTPGQLRDAVAIPTETYRNWRKSLPPLKRQSARRRCFTAGDLLAVAIVRTMTENFSIRIGAIVRVAESLFKACNTESWPDLERSKLIIDLANGDLQVRQGKENIVFDTPAVVIPLGPLVERIRDALLADGKPDRQGMLPFPLTPQPSRAEVSSAESQS